MYKESPLSPEKLEPSVPPVIAKLLSPVCLPEPQLFYSANSGSGSKSVENGNNRSSGGLSACVGQERQSAFTFNVSALNPGHIIVGVVTNDSRITKCASNDECRMVIIRGSLMGGPELPDSIVSVQLVYSYIKALYTL